MSFHFANAPLLPLVGQKLAQSHPGWATALMSGCIVAAQLIMLPVALAVGRTAGRLDRKPILLLGFAVLPVRAVLYTLSDSAPWLIAVQLVDGVGAGIFGAITPLVIADLMRGSGRFNLAQGAVATAQGVGASLSGLAAGIVVDRFGYAAAFLCRERPPASPWPLRPWRCPKPARARMKPASHQASGRHEAPTPSYRPCWIAESSQLPPRGRTNVHSSVTICRSFGLPSTTRPVRSVVTSIVE